MRRRPSQIFLSCTVILASLSAVCSLPAQEKAVSQDIALFARPNLVAWCIVPFDAKKRGPEERAVMLKRLGFERFAYDWRAEHLPTFDAELEALKKQGVRLDACWFPAQLNKDALTLLDALARHHIKTQLWITMGTPAAIDQAAKVEKAAATLRPVALAAAKIGCTVALYNHGGWFGEPENQLAIIDHLKLSNVGIVYNLHHGHAHVARFAELLTKMKPHLWAVNLNGMVKNGDQMGKKILPLGQGDLDLGLLKTIRASGYRGPIGILGHTMDDAEQRLQDNLDGLDWLTPQVQGKAPGPRPIPRTYKAPTPKNKPTEAKQALPSGPPYDPALVAELVTVAKTSGNAARGALVFRSPQFACMGCHKVGKVGGMIGPDLSRIGICLTPDLIVESLLWPKRQVKDEYKAHSVVTADGKLYQGYKDKETAKELVLREPATGAPIRIARSVIEEQREIGTLMPDGLTAAMSADQRRDLLRFLMELGHTEGLTDLAASHAHTPAVFPLEHRPLEPKNWPNWQHPVNQHRLYDFYAREADYFGKQASVPGLLPEFPGLDGPRFGHWGSQNEKSWADDRWNQADLGSLMCGVFRGPGVLVPKGVCVRLGERGELAACFNPETLCYEALWQGGFVKFSAVRHGFMDGIRMDGTALPAPAGKKPEKSFAYHGFYRHGRRVLFSYTIDGVRMLDAPWAEDGKFTRVVQPADTHPLAKLTAGGPSQWPQVLETRGSMGTGGPYAIDTIQPPFDNPWKVPVFFGDHDFLPDGSALVCTMQGDVWHVQGLDGKLDSVRWRRFASGLHQALGLVVADSKVYVLGRDQITCLHEPNGAGEANFYECFSSGYLTSPSGHDYLCGLQRDTAGNFYTASSKQGLLRISSDGKKVDVLATGFRNPDGVGLYADGALTVPCSEGDWTPASMICLVQPGKIPPPVERLPQPEAQAKETPPSFGFGGPKNGQAPALPLVYLPRGLDNSSGGQAYISSERWGPLQGRMVHFSHGACAHFLLLREEVDGQPQGAVVPLAGDFFSGVHRGRFNPKDGQLYVTGMSGWGTYALADGCFQRVRYTGEPVQLPAACQVHENGILVSFTRPVDRVQAGRSKNHFAQSWNYRYSAGYGSPEFSPRHPGTPGHDPLTITAAHVLPDGRGIFLEIPDLQPVNQLHVRLRVDSGPAHDLYLTVHRLGKPFTQFPDYRPARKIIAAHPILSDLRAATRAVANPWRRSQKGARLLTIEADKNLTFTKRTLTVRAGELIKLTFNNPDAVPHNWVLLKPGTLASIGDLANRLIADPDALDRQYVPKSPDILVYTNIVPPQGNATIWFQAPADKGRYPYLCTFPGHWMVMNGQMIVE